MDGPDDLTKALNTLLHENYPDRAPQLASMVPSIVASVFPYTTHTEPDPSMPDNTITFPEYTGTADNWPSDLAWSLVYTEEKARRSYREAVSLIKTANPMSVSALNRALEIGSFNRRVREKWSGLVGGKPLTAAYLMYFVHPTIAKKGIPKAYKAITGKSTDTRLLDVVLHSITAPVVVEPAATEPTMLDLASMAESNTQAILEVMEDLTSFKGEIKENCDPLRNRIRECVERIDRLESKLNEAIAAGFDPRTNAKLAQMKKTIGDEFRSTAQNFKHEINRTLGERVKALEDFRSTQGPVGSDWEARIESRIKDLETDTARVAAGVGGLTDRWGARIKSLEAGIIMDPEGEAEWKERFAQMKEDLRGDISNAFDALAAEQPSGDVSSNPLAALEHVKAALKAAGFKGTLTLTIE
tara:strand:- start:149 stop:1390 length:1242 start_codon:yes stop_codon:yes gene_type:complete